MSPPPHMPSAQRRIPPSLASDNSDNVSQALVNLVGIVWCRRSVKATAWLAAGFILSIVTPLALMGAEVMPSATFPGADLFTNGTVRQLRIEITPTGVESLRRDPRAFVHA